MNSVRQSVREWFHTLWRPGIGRLGGAEEVCPSPDGTKIAFVGLIASDLERRPYRRMHLLDAGTAALTELGQESAAACPRWSPDGQRLGYLTGDENGLRPIIVDRAGRVRTPPLPELPGVAECLDWSPDGTRLLIGVAEPGAEIAGGHGSGTLPGEARRSDWTPEVISTDDPARYRRCFVIEIDTGRCWVASPDGLCVWEACWSGPDEILAVVSADADENAWYAAHVAMINVSPGVTGTARSVYRSDDQLGRPACSPSGWNRCVLQAVASDRGFVQGDVVMLDRDGQARRLDVGRVDVTDLGWRDENRLVFAGIRGMDAVVGEIDVVLGKITELWVCDESFGGKIPTGRASADGTFFTVRDGHARRPELVAVGPDGVRSLLIIDNDGADRLGLPGWRTHRIEWPAPDGLIIQGLYSEPRSPGPHPLIVQLHGGPIAASRDRWLLRDPYLAVLASRGYAVLQPNPRGSSGRGQEFARMIKGDMNGADTLDVLSGIDQLITTGAVDPDRIGVTGGSYGGNMTTWLITQDPRFAAAVAWFPHTDYVSFHYTSNIGEFDKLFLNSDPTDPTGRHATRSAFRYAHNVRTPVLQLAGALDRCCPPGQAIQFHRAVAEHGVPAELVIYPQEGHGMVSLAAQIDSAARAVEWFERYMPGS